ncbi:MAG: nicotinamide-nucleotide amidohydrolase family protein [Candidatus Thermoplasmatota archaeon]
MSLPEEVGSALRAKGLTIAVAESCTGGRLGDMITSVPGSSDYFLGGVISYSDEAKVGLLGVSPESLEAEGAVSEAVARQMAEGARRAFGADVGVSTTGIAGPDGGSPSKPVGLVFIAASTEGGTVCSRHVFPGARDDVKTRSSESALALVRDLLA